MKNAICVCVVGLVSAGAVWAQAVAGGGAVTGTVREAAGDGIPDCTVSLSNASLGLLRTMNTSDDGVFFAPVLPPVAGYRLKVSRKGFADWLSAEFAVRLGETLNFAIDLKTDAPAAEVHTSSVLPLVDNHKLGVNSLIVPEQLFGLPASERRLDPFVLLAPGVNTAYSSGQTAFLSQPASNSFQADGIDTTNGYYGERAGIADQLPQNFVQELQVMVADSPAEFGRYMGGTVNAVTKTGTAAYHGSAEDYLRLPSMTAAGKYAEGQNLLHKQNQGGASVGGPVRPESIFFFAGIESQEGKFDGLNRILNPLIADPTGTVVAASNCKATAAQCAAAEKFIQSQMNVLVPFSDHWTSGIAKVDYRRSDRNSISLEANAMNSRSPVSAQIDNVAANGGFVGLGDTLEQTRFVRAAWTSAPTQAAVNELRFGFFEDRLSDPASQSQLSTGGTQINLAGTTIGAPHPYASLLSEHRDQLVDNLTVTSGSHTLRVGADFSITGDYQSDLANQGGTYYYNSLTNFAQDFSSTTGKSYTLYTQQFGNPDRTVRSRIYSLYAQDTWKVTPNFTVTAGVRFEKPHLPQPVEPNSAYYLTGQLTSPNNDFSPRVGFSYMLDSRTVFRAGYGWFFAPYPGELLDALYLGGGLYQTNISVNPNQTGAPAFGKALASTAIPTGTSNLMYGATKLRNPHTAQVNLALERSLSRGTTASVSLISSRGYKLWTADDINLAALSKTATYTIDNSAGQAVTSYTSFIYNAKNDPNFAHVYQVENGGSSWYDALAVELRKQMAHGVSLQASYTWSHAIGDATGPLLDGVLPLHTVAGDSGFDKGNLPTDQRQRVALNWIWQPRVTGSTSPAARFLANGWQISALTVLASGEPATEIALPVGQQFSAVPMAYTTSLNGSGGWARWPLTNVGTLKTGATYNADVRVSRTLPFTERIQGVLMFEAFNVFNHQSVTAVNTIAYTGVTSLPAGVVSGPTAGILKPVAGLGDGIASLGYPDGTSARRVQVAFRVVF